MGNKLKRKKCTTQRGQAAKKVEDSTGADWLRNSSGIGRICSVGLPEAPEKDVGRALLLAALANQG